jgi:uncharacterized protein GlcG (DUF336 family)
MTTWRRPLWLNLFAAAALTACGGGGDDPTSAPGLPSSTTPAAADCSGDCGTADSRLQVADVQAVIARAVTEAQARNARATIAVVDRVGNVLGVFVMNGAAATVTLRSTAEGEATIDGGLEGVAIVPATMAAIAKAITGAFLSSEGNAFSTRTASQIVQSHFNPGEYLAPGGPLFGVQFSQLPCSDLNLRALGPGSAATAGPQRSPLGLSADPGGFPLYIDGAPVGGVGVVADGLYGLDDNILDIDTDLDEAIALAATAGHPAPPARRADRITADGKTLRYTDIEYAALSSAIASPPAFASLSAIGSLVAVTGYTEATLRGGTAFGQRESGVTADRLDYPGLDAFVLVDAAGNERFRPRAGSDGVDALTETEVRTILFNALRIAQRSRAQIRKPLGLPARVSITVVDSQGEILGIVRSRDAPVFGLDVSVQKARTATLLSSATAASVLNDLPSAVYLDEGLEVLRSEALGQYVGAFQRFIGVPAAFTDGRYAFSSRAVGNLARPFYPDGVDLNDAGPLSKPAGQWSPLSTGLQLDVVYNAIIHHVAHVTGLAPDVPRNCSGISGFDTGFTVREPSTLLANGLQIFPGGVPLYRGNTLIGGIGVSGDGVDQDDMVAFLGVATAQLGSNGPQHASAERRADQLEPFGSRLRYVNCPQSPFLDSNEQEPCRGY